MCPVGSEVPAAAAQSSCTTLLRHEEHLVSDLNYNLHGMLKIMQCDVLLFLFREYVISRI